MSLDELRKIVAGRLDLPAFSVPADLEPNDRERLYDGMADYIVENWDQFGAAERQWASRRIDSPFFKEPLEEFGAGDALKSFAGEFANQAKRIVSFENEFVKFAALGLFIGAGLYFAIKADKASRVIRS